MLLDVELVRSRVLGREIVWLESTTSTMTVAAGLPPGAVVVAEEQTAGQGRHGRNWHSEKGTGLYVSIVLRPELPQESLQTLTLAMGLAAHDAIEVSTGVCCELKWPNDLQIRGRKCAGVLVRGGSGAAIAGIGVNVNQTGFPTELQASATSLKIATGREHSREELLVHLVAAVDKYAQLLAEEGDQRLLALYAKKGKFVTVPVLKGDDYAAGS